ncbi:MAG: EAL domain-containing protein [Treponema sp.]|nr:EAL domain-containing protein [Treponema sp.]
MTSQIINEKFRKFYESLNIDVFSIDEMVARIDETLPTVADEFHLGKVETVFTAPESVYEPKGLHKVLAGYDDPNGHSDETYEKHFNTAEGGTVALYANPKKDWHWSDADKADIDFLLQVLYISCSRLRLLSLMKQTQNIDMLTGSLNIMGFEKKLAEIYENHTLGEYSSIFSNIKNFKYINQHVGTDNGDYILKHFSMAVRNFLGDDGLFCRLGGDNFVTLVKKYCLLRYIAFVSGMNVTVNNKGKEEDVQIDFKSGVFSILPDSTPPDVLSCASIAFQVARRSRDKDTVYFQPEMLEKTIHDKRISAMFSGALSRNEFMVYYQPKVTLADDTLCGCEALTRWHTNKIIYPGEFIEILEREGSIKNLDFYMLEEVCKDVRRWLDMGIEPVRISTNFSKTHLSNENLEKDIISILEKYKISPKYIEIELTELSDFKYLDRLISFVNVMHNMGFHISIDDFGTGYSSMSLIRDLNADVVKLDKSLVDNIACATSRKADAVIVRSIINMAKELGIQVIAEGVETKEQASFLRENGCLMAQGFLYDRPLVKEDFEKRLRSRKYSL